MFRHVRSQEADLAGIVKLGETPLVLADLVRRFGKPAQGDGYKISGEYVFLSDCNEAFVVHDWKNTNQIFDHLPSPEQFWAGTDPVELSISGLDVDATAFVEWLRSEIGSPATG